MAGSGPAGRPRCGIETHVARHEAAAGADVGERRGVELDAVPVGVEAADGVGIGRAEFAEHDVVLPAAAGHAVVAGAALEPVVAAVAVEGVVAGAADYGGVSAYTSEHVIAANTASRGTVVCIEHQDVAFI